MASHLRSLAIGAVAPPFANPWQAKTASHGCQRQHCYIPVISGLLISRSRSRFFDALSNSFKGKAWQSIPQEKTFLIHETRSMQPCEATKIQQQCPKTVSGNQYLVDSKKLGSKIGPRGQLGRLACYACLQGLLSYLLRSVPDPSGYSTWQHVIHVIHVIHAIHVLSFHSKAWAHRIFKRFLRSNFVNSKFSYCNTCTNLFKWPIKNWHSSKGKIVKSLKLWHIDKRLFSHCCKSLIGRMDRISFSVAMHLFGSWQSGVEYVHEGRGLYGRSGACNFMNE